MELILDKDNTIDLSIEKDILQDLRISVKSFDLSWKNKPELVKAFYNQLYLELVKFQIEQPLNVYLDSSFLMLVPFSIKIVPLGFLLEYCRNYSSLQATCYKYTFEENTIEITIENQELFIIVNNSYFREVKKDIKSKVRLLKSICAETRKLLKNSCLEYIIIEPIHDEHTERVDDFALAGNFNGRFIVFTKDLINILVC